jgi:hypothetical protein
MLDRARVHVREVVQPGVVPVHVAGGGEIHRGLAGPLTGPCSPPRVTCAKRLARDSAEHAKRSEKLGISRSVESNAKCFFQSPSADTVGSSSTFSEEVGRAGARPTGQLREWSDVLAGLTDRASVCSRVPAFRRCFAGHARVVRAAWSASEVLPRRCGMRMRYGSHDTASPLF